MRRFLKQAVISAAALAAGAIGLREAHAWPGPWEVEAPKGSGWAEAHGQGINFNTALIVKCSHDLAGVGFTLRDFWGTALGRSNGERYSVRIVIRNGDGHRSEFYVGLRYDADEQEWSTDGYDMPRSFLDAFAKGATMRFDASAIDGEIATYRLKGSAIAARTMRAACWERFGG